MPNEFLALPHLKQERDYACTPACVRMVLSYYGLTLSEDELISLLRTTLAGTEFEQILNVASLGFTVRVETGTLGDLRRCTAAGEPCVARIKTCHLPHYPLPPWVRHSVVVAGVTASRVYYHDPAQDDDPASANLSNFDKAWAAGQYKFALITPTTTDRAALAHQELDGGG